MKKARRNNIVFVPIKARGGFITNCNNPNYQQKLRRFSSPRFDIYEILFAFEIEGDSMSPVLRGGDTAFSEEVSDLCPIRDGQIHILIINDGIIAKRVTRAYDSGGLVEKLELESENPAYRPFKIDIEEVRKIYVVRGIETNHACSEI